MVIWYGVVVASKSALIKHICIVYSIYLSYLLGHILKL